MIAQEWRFVNSFLGEFIGIDVGEFIGIKRWI
jgi:hypothetical protein